MNSFLYNTLPINRACCKVWLKTEIGESLEQTNFWHGEDGKITWACLQDIKQSVGYVAYGNLNIWVL